MLYKEWVNEWLEFCIKPSAKERTYRKYRRTAEKYLLPALGGWEIGELTAMRLQKFSAELCEEGLKASTVNGILFVLRSSLKKAVALGVADRQCSDALIRPPAWERKVACFCKEEQKQIEQYIRERNSPYLFGILLALYTGLRLGEVLALTWEDVDFGRGMLTVSRSCHDGWKDGHYVKIFDTTKTKNSERVIPLPKKIAEHMKELKRLATNEFVVAGKTECGAEVRSYQRSFDALLKKLGIAHKGFHALRHTFATRALEAGMDVKTLSEILGHKSPMITLRCYAHPHMEYKAEMMNKIGKQFGC